MADQTPSKPEKQLKVGQRIEVVKDAQSTKLRGTVAYVGTTLFSPGKWIGVVLDENKGKNNGTVMAKTYFSCKDGHGMFVRQNNCVPLDDITEECESPVDIQKVKSSIAPKTRKLLQVEPNSPSKRPGKLKLPVAATPRTLVPSIPDTPGREEPSSIAATPKGDMASKRASFVETGFMETLKAQFTPGQPLSPSLSMAIEERVTGMQLQHENENLKAEIRDLNEKLETLKVRRGQDKEKLKEADKMRLQLDQLLEFKKAILESQAQLQKELQRAKQEAKEATIAKQTQMDDDYPEMLEMAMLDKEMAEEKAESLQIELEQAKQKVEELTLDLELLKAEMSDQRPEGAASSLEVKQLEQQNARFKDTLVKMRDLAAHEKHQQQLLQKELDEKVSEIKELSKSKASIATQLEEQRVVIAELQEQVDAALGAEEMVEQLTDRNLVLEEKIGELQDAVADLEQLHDMNEELQETARETELELREELDMARTKIQEAIKERDASQEIIADRNTTIEKFREVVQQLQTGNEQLRESLQRETNKPVGAPLDVIDYKKMFTETKTFTKTIDLELRKLDVQQALQHVQYLCSYMPESFMSRGGDHQSVQVLLLISRLLFKCDILAAQVKEKFPACDKWDAPNVVKSHAAERFSFGSRLLHFLSSLQAVCRQYAHALNNCSAEKFLEIGVLYPEIAVQEKVVDFYVELLRKDQLDENINLEGLEKAVGYFNNIYATNFQDIVNGFALLTDHARMLSAASDSLVVDSHRVQIMMQAGHEGSDVAVSVKDILNQATQWQNYCRTIKRRLPADGSAGPINLPKETQQRLRQASGYVMRLLKTVQDWTRMVSQQFSILTENDTGVPVAKMRELAHAAADKIFIDEDVNDAGFNENVRTSLALVTNTYGLISSALVDGHYDFDGTPSNEVTVSPVVLRAQMLKAEIKDLENLRHKLEQRETIIKEVNILLRTKQEEMSELNIRKEMAEKKLSNTVRDHEVAMEKLTRKLEDSLMLLKRKEKEFQDTSEHLLFDIETLGKEKAELKERLMHSSKKVLLDGLMKSTASLTSPVTLSTSSYTTSSAPSAASEIATSNAAARDSPLLLSEVAHLREALRLSRLENARFGAEKMRSKLESLTPLTLPRKMDATDSKILHDLIKKTDGLKLNLLRTCSQAKVLDPMKKSTSDVCNSLVQHNIQMKNMQRDVLQLQMSVARLAASRKPGAEIFTKLNSFPIPEFAKVLNFAEAETIGRLVLPVNDDQPSATVVLETRELKHLHASLLP